MQSSVTAFSLISIMFFLDSSMLDVYQNFAPFMDV